MRDSASALLLACGAALLLAACGSGNALSTGSLFGGPKEDEVKAAPPPKPITQADRLAQVASTSARAQRCSFYFDPNQLKASYLAAEQAEATPEQMQKLDREYDVLRAKVLSAIASDDGYCTEGRNRDIKASLTRHIAGDFNPPQTKTAQGGGYIDSINQGRSREVFVPEEVFNPRRKSVTKRVED